MIADKNQFNQASTTSGVLDSGQARALRNGQTESRHADQYVRDEGDMIAASCIHKRLIHV
jgi:hypothetical protein